MFKVILLVLYFTAALYTMTPYIPGNNIGHFTGQTGPNFGTLAELRSCARSLGVKVIKYSTGMKEQLTTDRCPAELTCCLETVSDSNWIKVNATFDKHRTN